MSITTVSSREFNQDVSRIKRATADGPVFITDRGQPAHVLLSIDDYQKIAGNQQNIVDLLAMPTDDLFDFETPKLGKKLAKPVDYS